MRDAKMMSEAGCPRLCMLTVYPRGTLAQHERFARWHLECYHLGFVYNRHHPAQTRQIFVMEWLQMAGKRHMLRPALCIFRHLSGSKALMREPEARFF